MVYTIIALLVVAQGIYNLVKFKDIIMPYLSLRLFYYTSIACMITTIAVCWMPFDTWWHWPWLFVSGLVHCLEITFEWCQSIAFIQLCFKLSHAHSLSQDMK